MEKEQRISGFVPTRAKTGGCAGVLPLGAMLTNTRNFLVHPNRNHTCGFTPYSLRWHLQLNTDNSHIKWHMKLESKLPDVGTTIFTVMSKMAADYNALNLSQGFPEFDVDNKLISFVTSHMKAQKNQYAPMQGIERLRQKIAEKTKVCYGVEVDPHDEITVTSGATEALYSAITSIIRPGDEAILFEPAYDSYEPVIKLCGGKPVFIKLNYPDYRVDWDQVKDSLSGKTRLIVLNSPHNPTGTILREDDLAAMSEISAQADFYIISDEVYEHIVFDGLSHQSLLIRPELKARSFVISSFGKTFHTTGWKTGYCIAPQQLSTEFRRIHQYVTFACNTPIQHAYADYLTDKSSYLNLPAFYQQKRDTFLKAVENTRFKPLACDGTYFQLLDYSDISEQSDTAFSEWLTKEKRLASIPVSVFNHDREDRRVLRFCFAKNDDTLIKAGEILQSI